MVLLVRVSLSIVAVKVRKIGLSSRDDPFESLNIYLLVSILNHKFPSSCFPAQYNLDSFKRRVNKFLKSQ